MRETNRRHPGMTRRRKSVAITTPATGKNGLEDAFSAIDGIRPRRKPLPNVIAGKAPIAVGRR